MNPFMPGDLLDVVVQTIYAFKKQFLEPALIIKVTEGGVLVGLTSKREPFDKLFCEFTLRPKQKICLLPITF